jgi:hypothetical protein
MAVEEVHSNPAIDQAPEAAPPARIPLGTLIGDMAAEMDSTKKTYDRYKQVSVLQPMRDNRDDVKQFSEERLEDLRYVAEAKENQNLWSFGHLISSAGYASASIIFGTYLFANGDGDKGKSFIYGGSALLANSLMDFSGGWSFLSNLAAFGNETIEQTLKATLPIATTLITFLYSPQNLLKAPFEHKILMQYIDKMMAWINMIVQVGNVYTSWMLGQAQRKLTVTEAKISHTLMKVQPLNLRNEALTNSAKQINDAMKGGIKKIIKGTSAIPMEAV